MAKSYDLISYYVSYECNDGMCHSEITSYKNLTEEMLVEQMASLMREGDNSFYIFETLTPEQSSLFDSFRERAKAHLDKQRKEEAIRQKKIIREQNKASKKKREEEELKEYERLKKKFGKTKKYKGDNSKP